MQAEFGCNAHLIAHGSSWLESTPSAVLGTVGAATLEFVFMRYRLASLDDVYNGYVSIAGAGEALATNCMLSICGSTTRNRLGAFHEYGSAGSNVIVWSADYWTVGISGHLTYLAVTREEDGITYKFYADGNYLETVVASQAPEGGTSVSVRIGGITGSVNNSGGLGAYNSARWSHGIMAGDQLQETYYGLRMAA
jgi:hypothetical protein